MIRLDHLQRRAYMYTYINTEERDETLDTLILIFECCIFFSLVSCLQKVLGLG